MIYLTSFKRCKHLPRSFTVQSAAVYQPRGFELPKAEWADIRQSNGTWTRPREFLAAPNPLGVYRQSLYDLYMSRKSEVEHWIGQKGARGCDIALCCWCPYDRAAQRQLKEFGSFVCHLTAIGEFLANEFGLSVWSDEDRLKAAVLT